MVFIKTIFIVVFLISNMYSLDDAERPHPGNQLSFMLHELVFLWCHSQFASYPYTLASYLHNCKILQPYVVATVLLHSDAIFFSIGASRIKTFIKNQCWSTNSGSLQLSVRTLSYFLFSDVEHKFPSNCTKSYLKQRNRFFSTVT